ncbi:MAG: DUF4476 domain-containing protein [Bacteroidetes bacterium]|nr:DUF4476 domain-containing protein [Bacteroidota bacterium]
MQIRLLIFLLLVFSGVHAQNNLRLISENGRLFKAYANNKVLNEKPEASILVENIKEDTLVIRVEFEDKEIAEGTLYFLEKRNKVAHKEFNYLLDNKHNKVKFTFTGMYPIITLPEPLVPVKPVVDTSYKLRNNLLGHYCELKEGKALYFNNIPSKGDCKTPMPKIYLTYYTNLVKRAQTEDDKYAIAENTCRNNCISVSQLNKILALVPYELEKLKLIRTAYYHITDKKNKSQLDSSFKLESSKKELNGFLTTADETKQQLVNCTKSSPDNVIGLFCEKLSVYANDAERYQIFKKTYADYCYSTAQVKQVLKTFIHDREKLDAAKALYYYCTEKEKFEDLSESFSYNTTTADLKDFVSKQKN